MASYRIRLNFTVGVLLMATAGIITTQIGHAQTSYATIYSFQTLPDGAEPHASVTIGPQGALYGTTSVGGACGYGTVFELTNPRGVAWTETILHSFCGLDGKFPQANLSFGPDGALYGTTEGGGTGGGTVFALTLPASGQSPVESVLFDFSSNFRSAINAPVGSVLFDRTGRLYTTTRGQELGQGGGGVITLSPPPVPTDPWNEATVYEFIDDKTGSAGSLPLAGLVSEGLWLFGTTYYNGNVGCGVNFGCGAVYQLKPPSSPGGIWTEFTVHDFSGPPNDGAYPEAPVTVGRGGVLYGTTIVGGPTGICTYPNSPGCGTVFQVAPSAPGTPWLETVLTGFTGQDGDGAYPVAAIIVGVNGKLYGTTQYGGNLWFVFLLWRIRVRNRI